MLRNLGVRILRVNTVSTVFTFIVLSTALLLGKITYFH